MGESEPPWRGLGLRCCQRLLPLAEGHFLLLLLLLQLLWAQRDHEAEATPRRKAAQGTPRQRHPTHTSSLCGGGRPGPGPKGPLHTRLFRPACLGIIKRFSGRVWKKHTKTVTIQQLPHKQHRYKMSLRGPTPLAAFTKSVHLCGDQVQGVIHAAQTSSVIHSPQGQSVQVSLSESEDSQDSSDSIDSSQKARGILARRPSYRKILNDLSSEDTHARKGDEANVSTVTSMSVSTPVYQTSTGQYIAIAPNGPLQLNSLGAESMQGLQAITNAGGTPLLQYMQTSDGQQILVPSNQVVVQTASGDMQTYQIRSTPTTTSLPQTVVMTSPVSLTSQSAKTDDPQLKREIRLMKNREAARECRRKKKEYVKCLENRVAVLENQNKTLIEELKTLKDLYCHKNV
ncbi:cyclic AMP-dependent transcription factor ATF-1 isoform X2 [Sceloporus undulatus]|uniref:cyclic AMP-dependent transcription factor ATF-1 isoform X2 n=1 Tax=Sceloporus undulatus TaxID=8520 RepID=UPI001C4CE0A9|nr:cyclic AMP-dependent transcription factor ATF-1 isoform X2 [Sceloporus undulatus]